MYRASRSMILSIVIMQTLSGCLVKRYPFKFERDITASLLRKTVQIKLQEEESEIIPSGKAHVYRLRFMEGWLSQDNFIDRAVLSEDRIEEFIPYDRGFNNLYDCYLILYELENTSKKRFLLFTIQSRSGPGGATGFGKVYFGQYSTNGRSSLLSASKLLKLKIDADAIAFKQRRDTKIRFILRNEIKDIETYIPIMTHVAFSDKNELSGSKTLEIPIDEVMGKENSIKFKKISTITLPKN